MAAEIVGNGAVFFHFHRPSKSVSVHAGGKCYITRELEVLTVVRSRFRSTQPHFVMAGRGKVVRDGDKIVIYPYDRNLKKTS